MRCILYEESEVAQWVKAIKKDMHGINRMAYV